MNTDAHHSGKAHSTHDIAGSPATHGSYTLSHKYSTHDITGSPSTHGSYTLSHKYSTRVYTVTATDTTTRVYNKLQSQKYNTILGR